MVENTQVEVVTPNNEELQVEQTTKVVENTTETKQDTVQTSNKVEEEKVFTQAQLDEIVVSRLSKEKVRMLKKLGITDESQIDPIIEKSKNYDEVLQEATLLKQEREARAYKDILVSLNTDPDLADYVMQKVEKGETLEEFATNAQQFLEANPKFKTESYKLVNSSLGLGGREVYPDFEKMTTEQYLKWREKNKL